MNEAGMRLEDIQNFSYLLCCDNQLHCMVKNTPGLVNQCTQVARAAGDLYALLRYVFNSKNFNKINCFSKLYPQIVPYETEGVVDLDRLNDLIDRPI